MKIKCIDNKGNSWFKVGNVYKAWRDDTGALCSECELDNAYHGSDLNNGHGVFEMVEEEKPHPHADLMLKYAMIAQYDDKPWENFEFRNSDTDGWMRVINPCWDIDNEYRLKPQEPKIQVGQIWVSREGVEATIITTTNTDNLVYFTHILGGVLYNSYLTTKTFLSLFKRK